MSAFELTLLFAGGVCAGVVNTIAGAGSLLTVPLLVLLGLPGTLANGTNRVGVCVQNAVAAWRFRAERVSGFRPAIPVLVPTLAGSVTGAYAISTVSDKTFERLFGIVMLALLASVLRAPARRQSHPEQKRKAPAAAAPLFFAIGLYGGALQAGVGIVLVIALSHTGLDLVRANSVKVVVILALTAVALPVFIAQHQIAWLPATILAAGQSLGATLGARWTVRGGERVIRPILALACLALAGRMLGLY